MVSFAFLLALGQCFANSSKSMVLFAFLLALGECFANSSKSMVSPGTVTSFFKWPLVDTAYDIPDVHAIQYNAAEQFFTC
jgi:hypothetical protein